MNFVEYVQQAAASMGFLVSVEIRKAFDPSFEVPDTDEAMDHASESVQWLLEAGHGNLVSSVMEGIEAGSWWASPEVDLQAHSRLVQAVFAEVNEAILVRLESNEEVEEDALSEEREFLTKCLAAS